MSKCLVCYNPIKGEDHYHEKCLKTFWQDDTPILKLNYELSNIEELAKENVAQRITVTGVQPKISLGYTDNKKKSRLTIVGALNGRYILKPPFNLYPQMPEIEALSMLLAKACGISTVLFLLITMKSGELAYLTRRIDRTTKNEKYPMEDACQFMGRLTEHKYRGSYEQIAKGIIIHARNPLLDVVKFYEQVIVSFLIGNNDMHLKNFSMIAFKNTQYQLAPAYDMIAANLLIPEDKEELALNLNGKKRKLKRKDFNIAMTNSKIPKKAIENLWNRIEIGMQSWQAIISYSFLSHDLKEQLIGLIKIRANQIDLHLNDN